MTKLYLHIGTEKTGSTTIQDTLFKNRKTLSENGILYPSCFNRANHVELAVIAQNENKSSELNAVVGFNQASEAKSTFIERTLLDLKQEVNSTKPMFVIMSNEHLHSRLTDPDEIKNLKDLLSDIFEEIVVVCYIREQLELAVSHYSTMIKSGGTSVFSLPLNSALHHYYDFDGMLSKWEGAGFSNIICREFSRSKLKKGDILFDFLDAIDLGVNSELVKIEEKNQSLGWMELAFLREINNHLPLISNGMLNPDRQGLVTILERISASPTICVDLKLANDFRNLYASSNRNVEEKYFSGLPIFENKKNYSGVDDLVEEHIFSKIFREFWVEVKREFSKKDREISVLKQKNEGCKTKV